MSSAAPRVMRGWIAASMCTWTAFAAHAQVVPTAASAAVMMLITCVSAVIAMALLGRKYNLLTSSVVVLLSQGLYHLSLSVMSHGAGTLVVTTGTGVHAHHVTSLSVTGSGAASAGHPMVVAHLLAAVASIFMLRQGERIATLLVETLSLANARRILTVLHRVAPGWPKPVGIDYRPFPVRSVMAYRLPLLRGPPSPVLTHC